MNAIVGGPYECWWFDPRNGGVWKRRVPVGVAVLVWNHVEGYAPFRELLLMRRTGGHGEGTWAVPGGWKEPLEPLQDAAAREVWEEVGVEIQPGALDQAGFTHERHPEGVEAVTCWYSTTAWQGEPRAAYPDRVVEVGFFPVDALPTPLFPALKNALDEGLVELAAVRARMV